MILWIDAQLSPSLAPWIKERFAVEAFSMKYLGLSNSTDRQIFHAARDAGAVVMTKDGDFLRLLEHYGPPPQVLWVTLGNTSNARMKAVLESTFHQAAALLKSHEPLVELGDVR